MDLQIILPPALMLVGAGAGIALLALNLRKARTIEDTPTAKIRSAAQGYISVSGIARAIDEDPLIAPLTGKTCLWYDYVIERENRDNKGSRWATIEQGSSEKFFALDDGTGVCHVDPGHADVTATTSQRWKGSDRHPRGLVTGSDSIFSSSSRYRYTEKRIHAHERIYVLGSFETLHAPSQSVRTEAQTKLLLNEWKQDRDALLARFDLNRDGEIDLCEWEQARRAARQQAAKEISHATEAEPINTMSRPPSRTQPYLIGTKDPHELAKKYRWEAILSLAAGFGFAAFVFWKYYPH